MDGIDVDSYFYHNNFDLSQSQHRIVRVSRGSNKKLFAIKLFQFCGLKTQQRYILQEEKNISKRELTYLVDSLRDFPETFDHANKCIQIPLPKLKLEIGSTKSKDNLFAPQYNDIIEHPNRQIRLSFRFGNNNSCVFSVGKLELHRNHFIPTEFANLYHHQFHHLHKNRYCKALFISLATCIVGMKCFRANPASRKRLFNLSAEAIINVCKARLCAKSAIFLLKIKQFSSFDVCLRC